jgi:hypothetical protein
MKINIPCEFVALGGCPLPRRIDSPRFRVSESIQASVELRGLPHSLAPSPFFARLIQGRFSAVLRGLCRALESTHELPPLPWSDGEHPIGRCGKLITLLLWLAMPAVWRGD